MALEENLPSPLITVETGLNGEEGVGHAEHGIFSRSRTTRATKFQRFIKILPSSKQVFNYLLYVFAAYGLSVLLFRTSHSLFNRGNSPQPALSAPPSNTNRVSVDVSVDPCDDFYEFACGAPNSRILLPILDAIYTISGNNILGNSSVENGAEEKAQNYYRSCVKALTDLDQLYDELESLVSNEELGKMLEKLEKIPGKNLQEKLELLQNEYGLNPFFAWAVGQDLKDSDKNVIQVLQEESTVFGVDDPEKMSDFTSLLNQSAHFKTMMSKILGNRLNFTEGSDDFGQVMDLEKDIRELMQPPLLYELDVLNRYNSMNLTQLQDLAGFINWKKFFNSGFQKLNSTSNLKIDDNEEIVVVSPQFLSRLSKKLEHLQNSPDGQKLLNRYLIWAAGKELLGGIFIASNTSREFKMAHKNSTTNYIAMTTCSAFTQQYFDSAVASMHRRHFLNNNPDLETRRMKMVQEMAENIREELIVVLRESEWLDAKSRDGAIDKARKARVIIGYPEGVKNTTLLEQFYDFSPKMNESDFIGNLISYTKAARQKNAKILRTAVDKNEIFTWPQVQVMDNNAFTIPNVNLIVLTIRNLLVPNFDPESPESHNYGRIGFTIGHEFFHLFSKLGSNWDGDGKFQNQSLWQAEETGEKMENQSSCFVRQYSKFSYPDGKSLNGTQTLPENLADNGGLDVVTRALFRLLSQKKVNMSSSSLGKDEKNQHQTLAGFTEEQSFFLSIPQQWCTAEPPEFSKDSHAPAKFRILGALQNSKAFSEAFNCPPKSRMNPEEKCSLF